MGWIEEDWVIVTSMLSKINEVECDTLREELPGIGTIDFNSSLAQSPHKLQFYVHLSALGRGGAHSTGLPLRRRQLRD